MSEFLVEITVKGPEKEGSEARYPQRDTLAELNLAADPERAMRVYAEALAALTKPDLVTEQVE